MRKLFFATTLLLFACMALPHAAQAQWTEAKLQKLYVDALRGEGMTGKVDDDGDVQFSYNDHTYFIEVNEDDVEFFRVVLPNIWPIESIQEHGQVLSACDAVNKGLKTVKARFVQTAPDGGQTRGTFYLNRPGKLRFQYDPPLKDFVVADGLFIYFYDGELEQQSNAPISHFVF